MTGKNSLKSLLPCIFVGAYLAWQALYPAYALFYRRDPYARWFAWQMFATGPFTPEVYLRFSDATERRIYPGEYFGYMRGELRYEEPLARHVCEKFEGSQSVHFVPPGSEPVRETQCKDLL